MRATQIAAATRHLVSFICMVWFLPSGSLIGGKLSDIPRLRWCRGALAVLRRSRM